jgi:hypothetical protein
MTTTTATSASSHERGIWYEAPRRRYRVRVYIGTRVAHQSYHRSEDDARAAHYEARARLAARSLRPAPLTSTEHQLAALLGESPLIHGDSLQLSQLMKIDEFLDRYYTPASRPARCTVWRWCRTGKLPSQRAGREYFIAKTDADAFTGQVPADA